MKKQILIACTPLLFASAMAMAETEAKMPPKGTPPAVTSEQAPAAADGVATTAAAKNKSQLNAKANPAKKHHKKANS